MYIYPVSGIYRVSVFVMVLNKPYSLSLSFRTTCPLYAVGLSDPCKSMDCKKGEQCIVCFGNPDECKDKNKNLSTADVKCIAPQKDGTLADWSIFVFKILAPVYTSNSACSTVRCRRHYMPRKLRAARLAFQLMLPHSSGCAKVFCAAEGNCVDSPSGPSTRVPEQRRNNDWWISNSRASIWSHGWDIRLGSGTEVQTGSATDIDLTCSMECPPGHLGWEN